MPTPRRLTRAEIMETIAIIERTLETDDCTGLFLSINKGATRVTFSVGNLSGIDKSLNETLRSTGAV